MLHGERCEGREPVGSPPVTIMAGPYSTAEALERLLLAESIEREYSLGYRL